MGVQYDQNHTSNFFHNIKISMFCHLRSYRMLVERSSFSYAEITKMILCDSMFKVLSLTVVLLCCETPPKITSCGVMFLDQDSWISPEVSSGNWPGFWTKLVRFKCMF